MKPNLSRERLENDNLDEYDDDSYKNAEGLTSSVTF